MQNRNAKGDFTLDQPFSARSDFAPRDGGPCLVVTAGVGVLPASSGEGPGVLLNCLQPIRLTVHTGVRP